MGDSKYINTIQGRSISDNEEDFVRIYLDVNMTPGFFSWVIPDGAGLRVGLGSREKGIRQRFTSYVKGKNMDAIDVKAALIPIGMKKLVKQNIALIGDAAGMVKATSGGGLYASLIAAKILSDNFDNLSGYETEFMKEYGREIKKSLLASKIFVRLTNNDLNSIADYIERDINLINTHGDIDYQSEVAKEIIKKHPRLLFEVMWMMVR
jgi:flavin-dependent dehydrogenase